MLDDQTNHKEQDIYIWPDQRNHVNVIFDILWESDSKRMLRRYFISTSIISVYSFGKGIKVLDAQNLSLTNFMQGPSA